MVSLEEAACTQRTRAAISRTASRGSASNGESACAKSVAVG